MTDSLTARAALGSVATRWDADRAVTVLYSEHYGSLVRMAALLVGDVTVAETVVQDSFVAMHGTWRRIRESDRALPYLHQCLVNRSRSMLRQHNRASRKAAKPAAGVPGADGDAPTLLEFAVVKALQALPLQQREALVLTLYGELTEAQAASAMGISRGAVKNELSRAVEALRAGLGAGR